MSHVHDILSRLDKVRQTGSNRWTARCPAHEDRGPSLSLTERDDKILLHCFAGCEPLQVIESIGLQFSDLFPEPLPPSKSIRRPFPAADVLDCVVEESKIVYLVARNVVEGKPVSRDDLERLKIAVERLDTAQEVVRG